MTLDRLAPSFELELPAKKARKVYFASGRAHPELAEDVATALGISLGQMTLRTHPNTEHYVRFNDSLRGKHAVIMQTHAVSPMGSVNDAIQEQLFMIDAAKRASAKTITAVMPLLGYARQDRKTKGREPISVAGLIRQFKSAGAKRLVSVDMHSPQSQGHFNGPFDHLIASPLFIEVLRNEIVGDNPDEVLMISADSGRAKITEKYANAAGVDMALMHKSRDGATPGVIAPRRPVPEAKDRTCVVNDDMIDTGGTLITAVDRLFESGAKRVIVMSTHPVLSEPAIPRLKDSGIDQIIVTDSVPTAIAQAELGERFRVLSLAPIIGAALNQIITNGSVSRLFGDENYM
jgi:ribose-phosphate pyrophosphokinase